jgi:hypothetical protein
MGRQILVLSIIPADTQALMSAVHMHLHSALALHVHFRICPVTIPPARHIWPAHGSLQSH